MKKDVFEELIVVKRSGQRVSFNSYKIAVAIKRAFDSISQNYDEKDINKVYEDVLNDIKNNYVDRKTIHVEDIQDLIENKLKEEKYFNVYNSFSEYRQKRAATRKVFTTKQQHKFIKAIEKITEDDNLKMDNSYKVNEILFKYGQTVVNEFAKSYLIDNKYLRAHEEGNIYIHEMDYFSLGVLSKVHLICKNYLNKIDLDCNLNMLLLNVRQEVSGEINIPAIDCLLEDSLMNYYKDLFKENINNYLKVTGFSEYLNTKKIFDLIDRENEILFNKDNYSQFIYSHQVEKIFISSCEDAFAKAKEVLKKQIRNLFNILDSKSVSSISFGTNGSVAGEIINQIILEVLSEIKPFKNLKIIFKQKNNEFKYLSEIHSLLLNGHEIRFAFINNSFNKDLNEIEYFADGIRLFENYNSGYRESNGRMVVASTSINMSRLALKSKDKSLNIFYQDLDDILELVKNNLLLTFETTGNKIKENYEGLFRNNILDDEKLESSHKIRKVIKNGGLMVGLIGLKECVSFLSDNEEKQYKLVLEILNYLNKKCSEYTNETKLNFMIYEPSTVIARRELMTLDKAIYGNIKKVTESNMYDFIGNLNSIKNNYKKQANIQKYFIGGNIIETFISKNISLKKLEELLKELIDSDIGFIKMKVKDSG